MKEGRAGLRPPFFWYDTDFLNFFLIFFFSLFFFEKSRASRTRPSFGMTTTQDISDIFSVKMGVLAHKNRVNPPLCKFTY